MAQAIHQPRLYVDVSELVLRDSKTGIQRVVRSIVHALLAHGVTGYQVEFVRATRSEPYRYAHKFLALLRGSPDVGVIDAFVHPEKGDIFLGLDFPDTVVPSQAAFLSDIQKKGVKVYFVVYDLLPIHFRQHFEPVIFENHTAWLNTITQADGAICISESVSIELVDWLRTSQSIRQEPFDIGWFHLGADIDASQPSYGIPLGATNSLRSLSLRPTFLVVGTLELRKGQAQALGAFRELWRSGADVNLVFVGKQGWNVETLISSIQESPEFGKRLFWFDSVSDEYLERVYAAADCLLAVSEGEGFGLPLIEAAHRKLPIIARDIPAFREVAGEHAFYFSGMQPSALADAVVTWLALFNSGRHPKSDEMPTLTWAQSTAQLLNVLLKNNWSIRWNSEGHLRCAGSDPRLKSAIGKRTGVSIETTAVAGFLFYGPYISLPAGDYRIRIHGDILDLGGSTFQVETTVEFGNKILSAHTFDVVRSDGLVAELELHVPIAVSGFEVRLKVGAETDIRVDELEILLLPSPSTQAGENLSPVSTSLPEGGNTMNMQKPKIAQSANLEELLLEDGEDFVEAAFLALLRRRPDANGGRIYLRALRNGTSKLQILSEIFSSDECKRAGGEIAGLEEACVREGIRVTGEGGASGPPACVTQITRAEQLLVLDDADRFIETAYWVLFKRAPDVKGTANCHTRLKEGASKLQILYELFTSAESREIGADLPGLRDAFAREGLQVVEEKKVSSIAETPKSISAAQSINELLGHQAGSFVECAYMTLLGRASDRPGYEHRLAQLLDGTSKIQILNEMAASPEALAARVQLRGLPAAVRWHDLSRIPIFGGVVRRVANVEGNSPAERRARATEQRLAMLEMALDTRVAELEKSVGELSAMQRDALSDREATDARIASLERSAGSLLQLIEHGGKQTSASAALAEKSEASKSAGRLALDLRAEEIARDLRRVQRGV